MFHVKDGQSPKLHHWTLSEMVFYFLFLLLLPHCCTGNPQVIGPTQPIMANVGDDVILPCHLQPSVNAATQTVEWTRPDLKPRFVYLWRSGEELLNNQNPSYVGRTSLFISELKNGNVSLKLSRVKLSDRGTYRCFIPNINRDTTMELLFGAVSPPGVNISKSSNGVSLDCRSEGWFPQPDVLWLDGEGRVLPAGPTETLRGPDGLFTVSSRLTVEKTNRDSFTCRVHQENINQTRETHIQVSADFFETCSCVVYVSFMVVILLGVVVAAAFVFWKWRQIQTKDRKLKGERKEEETLLGRLEDLNQDLAEKKKTLADLNVNLAVKKKTQADLNVDSAVKEKTLADLNVDSAVKEKTLADLNVDLAEKKNTLADLNVDLAEKRKTQEDLNVDLAVKKKTQEDLNVDLAEKRKTQAHLNEDLEVKKKTQEDLNVDLAEKRKTQEDLNVDLAEKRKTQADLNKDLTVKKKTQEDLNVDLAEKRKTQEDLNVDLGVKKKTLAALKEDLAVKNKTLEDLNKDLAVKKNTLEYLNEDLAMKKNTLEYLNKDLAVKKNTLEYLNEDLEEKKKTLEYLNKDLQEIQRKLSEQREKNDP